MSDDRDQGDKPAESRLFLTSQNERMRSADQPRRDGLGAADCPACKARRLACRRIRGSYALPCDEHRCVAVAADTDQRCQRMVIANREHCGHHMPDALDPNLPPQLTTSLGRELRRVL